jgi:hypothetical protein
VRFLLRFLELCFGSPCCYCRRCIVIKLWVGCSLGNCSRALFEVSLNYNLSCDVFCFSSVVLLSDVMNCFAW